MCFGAEPADRENFQSVLALDKFVKILIPQTSEIQRLLHKCSTAGANAQLCRLLYIAIRALSDKAGANQLYSIVKKGMILV